MDQWQPGIELTYVKESTNAEEEQVGDEGGSDDICRPQVFEPVLKKQQRYEKKSHFYQVRSDNGNPDKPYVQPRQDLTWHQEPDWTW